MSNSQRLPPGFGGLESSSGVLPDIEPPRRITSNEPLSLDETISWAQEQIQAIQTRLVSLEDGNPLAAVEQFQGQLRALEETMAMHRDEIGKIVAACVLYEKTLKDFQAAIDALIRREISLGFGVKALEEAVKTKGVADVTPEKFVERAVAFHNFLLSTLPKASLNAAHPGNAVDELPGEHPLPKGELH